MNRAVLSRAQRSGLAVVGIVLLAFLIAPVAGATVYCVNEPACPAGGVDEGSSGAALQRALDAAAVHANSGGPDRVLIGSGTYTRAGGFSYTGDAVAVQGAGPGLTTLTRDAIEGGTALTVDAAESPSPSVSALRVLLPAGRAMTGVALSAGRLEGLAIESPSGAAGATDLKLEGGTFAGGQIEAISGTGIDARGGEVSSSTVRGASEGVAVAGAGTLLRGDVISGGLPLLGDDAEGLVVEDSLVEMLGASVGVELIANGAGATSAALRNDALVGGGGTGVLLDGEGAPVSATLVSSIVSEAATPIAVGGQGSGTARVSTSYSAYDAGSVRTLPGGSVESEAVLASSPEFVSPLGGDFHLAPGSPLIDAGRPRAPAAGESSVDLGGDPRIVNGRRDVGPYEYQWRGPVASALADHARIEIGEPVSFSGTASTSEPGDSVASYQWSFDDGAEVAPGAKALHAFSSLGMHQATLRVSDLAGLSASVSVEVHVEALSICREAACGGCGAGEPKECVLGRSVAALRIRPGAFTAARRGGTMGGNHGGEVSYRVLGGVSLVEFSVRRMLPGVKSGAGCVAPRKSLRGVPCVRSGPVVGGFSRISPEGGNSFRLTGRIGGRALSPGRYALIARTASDRSGAGAQRALFRIGS